jgi:hypothetical protein
MDNNNFTETLVNAEISGKYKAIHAYDKMIWVVRSGFLTLIFAAWSIIIKSAIESKINLREIRPYLFILSAFSFTLAIGGYLVDRNYARRKFRVIAALSGMMEIILAINFQNMENKTREVLTQLLKISGDASNNSYMSEPYNNEIMITPIIYGIPSLLMTSISVIILFNF